MNPTTDIPTIKARILDTYDHTAEDATSWVPLALLRSKLAAPRDLTDQALRELAEDGAVMFTPEMLGYLLTPMDHHAALRVGGQDKHLISRRG